MGNTDKTLPALVADKDDIFPEIHQKEGKFGPIKYKKGLTVNDISEYARDIINFSIKEITNIKKQLSVLHTTDGEISSLLCELLEASKKVYDDLLISSNLLDDALQKIEKNSESVSRICKQLKVFIEISREEQADNISRFEEINGQIKNIEEQTQSLLKKEESYLQQIMQLREICVSYEVFKSLESRVNSTENSIVQLKDDATIIKENVRKLQQTCVSNEEFQKLISRVIKFEGKIKTVEEKIKEDIAQLQSNNKTILERVQNLEKAINKKSFLDTMWYKASVGVAALIALGISIFSVL